LRVGLEGRSATLNESVMAMLQSSTIEERILYWLSLGTHLRALAERLLEQFAVTVGDLPASAPHLSAEAGGLYQHSLEVALKAAEASSSSAHSRSEGW